MNDPFDAPNLTELFQHGADSELGTIDGVTFSALTIVAQKSEQGTQYHFYCLMRDWHNEPAHHLLNAQLVITSQQEQLELVNQQLQNALAEVKHVAWLKAENERLNRENTQLLNQSPVNSRIGLQRPITIPDGACTCDECRAVWQNNGAA